MTRPTLNDLSAFAAVATHRSFRRAADELGLSPSALSHTIRTLERNLGVRLLHRTTRSVSATEVGQHLLSRLGPVMQDLDTALGEVASFREQPGGTLRINAAETAARLLLREVVPTFQNRFPEVAIDIQTDGRFIDIVKDGFDAGVRLGEAVPQDMIAIRFGGDTRFVAVAAPSYLAGVKIPQSPDDLHNHACIRNRLPSGKLYHWEFMQRGQEVIIDVPGMITLDHIELMLEAAADGLGIAYVPERAAKPYLGDGRLTAVLEDWCPAISGLFLYYPGRRLVPPALRAFIDTLKEVLP